MVKYIDRNGNIQYVNTDYSRVPPEYMDQVRDQLEPEQTRVPPSKVEEEGLPLEAEPGPVETEEMSVDPRQKVSPPPEPKALPEETPQRPFSPPLNLFPRGETVIDLFVSDSCTKCLFTEAYLKGKGISYNRYDIDKDPEGRAKYSSAGGGKLPVVSIKGSVIEDADGASIESQIHSTTTPGQRLYKKLLKLNPEGIPKENADQQ